MRLARQRILDRAERYLAHISIGAVNHADLMQAIELFGTEFATTVQSETAPRTTAAAEAQATTAS